MHDIYMYAHNVTQILVDSITRVQSNLTDKSPHRPSKVSLPVGRSGLPSNAWFLGPT